MVDRQKPSKTVVTMVDHGHHFAWVAFSKDKSSHGVALLKALNLLLVCKIGNIVVSSNRSSLDSYLQADLHICCSLPRQRFVDIM